MVGRDAAGRRTLQDLVNLAWPVVLSRLGIMTMGLTDAIVVGNFASQELAFHALGWAPTSIIVTTAVGLMFGVQVMTARLLGEGRRSETGAVFRRGVSYALQIGFASMIGMILIGPWALRHMGLAEGLGEGASWPLIVFSLSMPAYLVSVAAQFFLEAMGHPKAGMWAIWVANGINLALNLLLVPDLLGLGFDGAFASAWATFFARGSLAVFLVWWIVRLPEAGALGIFAKPPRDLPAEREQRRIGYGGGSSYFVEVGAFAAMTFFAGRLGALETTAWTIALNVSAIVFMVPLGLSAATAVLVGRAYGARDGSEVLRSGFTGMALVAAITAVTGLLVWPFAAQVVSIYNREPEVLAIAAGAVALTALFYIPDAIQVVAASANRAAGDIWWPTIMHVVSYGLIMTPLGWLLSHQFGINGLVWAVIIASLVSAVLLTGRLWRVTWRLVRGWATDPASR